MILRRATPEDWARIYAWRNDPETRRQFRSARIVPLQEHLDWFASVLQEPTITIWMARDKGRDVGMIRTMPARRASDGLEVSLVVEPCLRQQGYAQRIVQSLIDYVEHSIAPGPLYAEVKTTNYGSLRTFVSAGFTLSEIRKGYACLHYAGGAKT